MMDEVTQDLALQALREAARGAPQLPLELLERAYAIEKAHQFDDGREACHRLLQKLAEEFLTQVKA